MDCVAGIQCSFVQCNYLHVKWTAVGIVQDSPVYHYHSVIGANFPGLWYYSGIVARYSGRLSECVFLENVFDKFLKRCGKSRKFLDKFLIIFRKIGS